MIEDRIADLIQGDIDGVNGEEESAELREVMARDADARELHSDLCRLNETLRQLPSVEPPKELRRSILDGIAGGHVPVAASRPRATSGRVWWPRAAMLAAGILVVLAAWPLLNTTSVAPDDVRGTIGPPQHNPRATIQLDSPGLRGDVSVEQTATEVRIVVRVSGSPAVEFAVEYDVTALTLVGIDDESAIGFVLEGGDGRATVQPAAEHDYVLMFTRNTVSETRIDFELMRDGTAVDGGTLTINPR